MVAFCDSRLSDNGRRETIERFASEVEQPLRDFVRRLASRAGIRDIEPADLVQDVFLEFLRCRGTYPCESPGRLLAVLESFARHVVENCQRKRWAQRRSPTRLDPSFEGHPERLDGLAARTPPPLDVVEWDERCRLVLVVLRGLTKPQRDLLTLVFVKDKSVSEAGRLLGIGLEAAKSLYRRALGVLRKALRRSAEFREVLE